MVDLGDRLLAAPLPGFPRLFPLGLHRLLEALHVERKAVLPDDVRRQVRGKAEGIVELEDDVAGNRFQPVLLQDGHRLPGGSSGRRRGSR